MTTIAERRRLRRGRMALQAVPEPEMGKDEEQPEPEEKDFALEEPEPDVTGADGATCGSGMYEDELVHSRVQAENKHSSRSTTTHTPVQQVLGKESPLVNVQGNGGGDAYEDELDSAKVADNDMHHEDGGWVVLQTSKKRVMAYQTSSTARNNDMRHDEGSERRDKRERRDDTHAHGSSPPPAPPPAPPTSFAQNLAEAGKNVVGGFLPPTPPSLSPSPPPTVPDARLSALGNKEVLQEAAENHHRSAGFGAMMSDKKRGVGSSFEEDGEKIASSNNSHVFTAGGYEPPSLSRQAKSIRRRFKLRARNGGNNSLFMFLTDSDFVQAPQDMPFGLSRNELPAESGDPYFWFPNMPVPVFQPSFFPTHPDVTLPPPDASTGALIPSPTPRPIINRPVPVLPEPNEKDNEALDKSLKIISAANYARGRGRGSGRGIMGNANTHHSTFYEQLASEVQPTWPPDVEEPLPESQFRNIQFKRYLSSSMYGKMMTFRSREFGAPAPTSSAGEGQGGVRSTRSGSHLHHTKSLKSGSHHTGLGRGEGSPWDHTSLSLSPPRDMNSGSGSTCGRCFDVETHTHHHALYSHCTSCGPVGGILNPLSWPYHHPSRNIPIPPQTYDTMLRTRGIEQDKRLMIEEVIEKIEHLCYKGTPSVPYKSYTQQALQAEVPVEKLPVSTHPSVKEKCGAYDYPLGTSWQEILDEGTKFSSKVEATIAGLSEKVDEKVWVLVEPEFVKQAKKETEEEANGWLGGWFS